MVRNKNPTTYIHIKKCLLVSRFRIYNDVIELIRFPQREKKKEKPLLHCSHF